MSTDQNETESESATRTTPKGITIEKDDVPASLQSDDDGNCQSTKYSSPDISTTDSDSGNPDDTADSDDKANVSPAVTIDGHSVEVIVDDELNPDGNTDRTKYAVHVTHPDTGDSPFVTHVMVYYWKDQTHWAERKRIDWRDARPTVQEKTTRLVADADKPSDLHSSTRLVEKGGETPY